MTLSNSLREYIAACFTGLWIQSHEHEDALAEIAQLCRNENWRLATWDIIPLVEAAQNVVPVAVTAAESVKRLRDWASCRCLDADVPGIYNPNGGGARKSRRSIPRDPSLN